VTQVAYRSAAIQMARSDKEKIALQVLNNHYPNVCEPLSDSDFAELEASILGMGIMVPVLLDLNGNVVDGHNRTQIAIDNDLYIPHQVVDVTSEDEASDLSWHLNRDRRHMTAKQKEAYTFRRIDAGDSIAEIAEKLKESPETTKTRVTRARKNGSMNQNSEPPRDLRTPTEIRQDKIDAELTINPNRSDARISKTLGDVTDKTIAARRKALGIEPFASRTGGRKAAVKSEPKPVKPVTPQLHKTIKSVAVALDKVYQRMVDIYEDDTYDAAARALAREQFGIVVNMAADFKTRTSRRQK
jgi:DNA-binding CsgD family transcriptional regulator